MKKTATIAAALSLCLALSGCLTDSVSLSSLNPFGADAASTPPAQGPQTTQTGQTTKIDQTAQKNAAQTPPAEAVAANPEPDTPPLICRVGRGSAHFENGWYDYRDTTFTLYDGVAATVTLTASHSAQKTTLQALFSKAGQKILFCPMIDNVKDGHIACASFYALPSDLQAGIKRTFDVPDAERDGDLTCAYTADHLRSFKLPPE